MSLTGLFADLVRAVEVLLRRSGPKGRVDRRGLALVFDADDVLSTVLFRACRQRAKVLAAARPTGLLCQMVRFEVQARWVRWVGRPGGVRLKFDGRSGKRYRCRDLPRVGER